MVCHELLKEGNATSCTDGGKDPSFTASPQPLVTRSRKDPVQNDCDTTTYVSVAGELLRATDMFSNCQIMV